MAMLLDLYFNALVYEYRACSFLPDLEGTCDWLERSREACFCRSSEARFKGTKHQYLYIALTMHACLDCIPYPRCAAGGDRHPGLTQFAHHGDLIVGGKLTLHLSVHCRCSCITRATHPSGMTGHCLPAMLRPPGLHQLVHRHNTSSLRLSDGQWPCMRGV